MVIQRAVLAATAAALPALHVHAARAKELFAYLGSTPVLDGNIQPSEWADAYVWDGIEDWDPEFLPVTPPANGSMPDDLNLTAWVKHDNERLFFAFRIVDDVAYGLQTPTWLPTANPYANNLTRQGFPWFGDEMEILLNPGNLTGPPLNTTVPGNGSCWQMVVNAFKSRLKGFGPGRGGLLEGEPRSSLSAWVTYQSWILSGAQQAAVATYAGAAPNGGNVHEIEWSVAFDPCLQLAPGVFYTPGMPAFSMGINIALGDVDAQPASEGNPYGLRHEMWLNGSTNTSGAGSNPHTLLSEFGRLWMMPGTLPPPLPSSE